jgi:hypothetical protein
MRRPIATAILAAIALMSLTNPAGALTPRPVRTSPLNEDTPAANRTHLAWSQNSKAHPRRHDLFVKPDGKPRFKVNAPGTRGFAYGTIYGHVLAYAQRRGGSSNIKFFNLRTKRRRNPPHGVNTARYETAVTRSGHWLLFSRSRRNGSRQRILLRNLKTRDQRLMVKGNGGSRWAQPGTVSGHYATYVKCRRLTLCNVFRYNIRTGKRTKVPNPKGRAQFAASVTRGGTVFFAESSNITCGHFVGIWSYPRGGPRTRLYLFPDGQDTGATAPVLNGDGSRTIFFDRLKCRTGGFDILKITKR